MKYKVQPCGTEIHYKRINSFFICTDINLGNRYISGYERYINNGGRNTKLYQAKFLNMDSLKQEFYVYGYRSTGDKNSDSMFS